MRSQAKDAADPSSEVRPDNEARCETVRVSSSLSPGNSKAWQHSKVFNDVKMFRNLNQQRISTYNMVTHGTNLVNV